VVSGLCYLLVPGLVLIAPQLNTNPGAMFLGVQTSPALWWMLLVYAVLGIASAGQDVGQMNYLLEMSPEGSRPTYLALYYLMGVPLAMLPLVGAAIIGRHGHYEIGFATSLILVSAMVWVLQGLGEVRATAKG
jgi:MFS family permease